MGVNMKKDSIFDNNAFTIVEIMIAIVISFIIMGAVGLAMRSGLYSSLGIEAKTVAHQNARAALETMALEISMASYNPKFERDDIIWADLTLGSLNGLNCSILTSAPSNPDRKGIVEATANSLTIEADINNDGIVGSVGQQNEVIRYVYVTAGGEQYITRCTCCTSGSTGGGGQPFLGNTVASGQQRTVRVINNQVGIPVFRYFNGRGVEFTPNTALTDCIQVPTPNNHICNIRRIDITLVVESDTIDPMTQQRHRQFYSTTVVPLNHVNQKPKTVP